MSTIQQAAAKWARKTANAGQKWKNAVTNAPYCEGFTKFLGHSPKGDECANWATAVGNVQATDFQAAISGKESKYIRGLENA